MKRIFEQVEVGDEVVRLVKPAITKVRLVRYAGASGDFNPLHTDDDSARSAGFEGVVAHGMLLMAFMTEGITTWVPQDWLRNIKVRFTGTSRPGDVITVIGSVAEKRIENDTGVLTCDISAVDQKLDVKVRGTFQISVPLGNG